MSSQSEVIAQSVQLTTYFSAVFCTKSKSTESRDNMYLQ